MSAAAHPADPLAQPTRARLFALLGELRRPASTDELAARVNRHANGVRVHLERLHDAALVTRERVRVPRGRPRDMWSVSAVVAAAGAPPSEYEQLARWLVRALALEGVGARDVERAGRQIGRELPGDRGGEARLYDLFAELGFAPVREPGGGTGLTYRLDNCPYRDAVRERQPLVCGLHRGIVRGMLDTLDPRTRLTGFVPKDPDTAGCLVTVRGPLAAEAP